MKPLGTITMCFPYIDERSKSLLNTVMDRAVNYADFTEQLCNHIANEETSPMLSYLAFYHAFHINDYNLVERLEISNKIPILAKPLHMITQYRRGLLVSWEQMEAAIRSALEAAPNDWLSCQLYLNCRFYTEFNMP